MTDDPYLNMPAPDSLEAVRLPFNVLYLSWENGQPQLRELGGPKCFGAWIAKKAQADEIEGLALPQSFGKYTRSYKSGEQEPCYAARTVTVSIFANRMRYVNRNDDKDGSMSWRPGFVQHIQWLAAMFLDQSLSSFVPVVMTTKGTQIKKINAAMKEWHDAIAIREAKLARYPISAFAITVGSYGEQPVYEKVTNPKTGESSQITPIKAAISADPAKRLIQPAVVQRLTELRLQAAEWLVNWNKMYGQKQLEMETANGAPGLDDFEDKPF